ncbi:hypothetical protein RhiirA4_457067 [Rhizophagus irregularis]|uniref:Uncharacterized protein n=1 Tax=Rhizophagus irregularis TaxID=588596 RepID=A0A2I1G923_9GLOM|nr:hypothetical protein RhiirA4_457067 [Rhizophagus irregularis]
MTFFQLKWSAQKNINITELKKWLEVGEPFEEDDEILAFKKAKETEARKNGKSVGEIIKTRSAGKYTPVEMLHPGRESKNHL